MMDLIVAIALLFFIVKNKHLFAFLHPIFRSKKNQYKGMVKHNIDNSLFKKGDIVYIKGSRLPHKIIKILWENEEIYYMVAENGEINNNSFSKNQLQIEDIKQFALNRNWDIIKDGFHLSMKRTKVLDKYLEHYIFSEDKEIFISPTVTDNSNNHN